MWVETQLNSHVTLTHTWRSKHPRSFPQHCCHPPSAPLTRASHFPLGKAPHYSTRDHSDSEVWEEAVVIKAGKNLGKTAQNRQHLQSDPLLGLAPFSLGFEKRMTSIHCKSQCSVPPVARAQCYRVPISNLSRSVYQGTNGCATHKLLCNLNSPVYENLVFPAALAERRCSHLTDEKSKGQRASNLSRICFQI